MTIFSAKLAAIKKALVIIFIVITVGLVGLAFALSLTPAYNVIAYFNLLGITTEVEYSINGVNQGMISLPTTITGLHPRDEVSLFLESSGNVCDNLLVVSDRAACTLVVNNVPYFSVGQEGTYPAFQKEPPRYVNVIALPDLDAGLEIRLDYTLSPIAHSLNLKPIFSGDYALINQHFFMDNYLAFILSIVLLILGVILAIIGLVFHSRAELAIVLFWLGMGCAACGIWSFFANDVCLLFFSQFSVFYTVSLLGLYVLPIPIARFCFSYALPYKPKLFNVVFVSVCLYFAGIIVLHVTGVLSFGQVEPYFRVISSILLMLYCVAILWARYKNKMSASLLFIFGMSLFAALSLFDAISSYIGIQSSSGTFFMVGLVFATIVVALLIWEYVGEVFDALEKNARLESDISAINRSLDLQRKHFQDFTRSAEETRRMRHDLRHQLVAIKGLINEGKQQEALVYIDNLSEDIPSISEMLVCDNVVVNSLAVHYLSQAKKENILSDFKMDVPLAVGRIPDADLSIIVGNLLENAFEACMHVDPDKRFIKVRCQTTAKRFTLAIDNSFDGELKVSGDDFYSRKRKSFGVGIASVRSVVKKYNGSMKYETESGVFKTSLYIKILDVERRGTTD